METNPNQRVITTRKEKCDSNNIYTSINIKALQIAMRTLKTNTFKLWLYLGKNQNNYTFALSRVDCLQYCGFSAKTYQTAFNELVELRYLVRAKKESNRYDFYELPQEEENPIITTHKTEPKEDDSFNF